MITLTAKLTFRIMESHSLKDKRTVARRLIDKARHRYNASIAEVGTQDAHQLLTLGIAVVSSEMPHLQNMMNEIIRFLEDNTDADLISVEIS